MLSRNKILPLCIFATTLLSGGKAMFAQTAAGVPKLVIGVTVEGMSEEYIDLLRDYFGQNGFNYILDNAVTFTDIDFGSPLDGPAANAVIHTGAAPSINGLTAATVFNPATRRVVPTLNSENPSAADEHFSPAKILSTTLSDELKINGSGIGHVHSVAPDASMAITSAGHAANTAYWINDVSGKWTTSTYYQDRPMFLQYRNRMQPLSAKLDTLTWIPLLDMASYPGVSAAQKYYPFKIRFQQGEPGRYGKYKAAPIVNNEVTEVALEYIKNYNLGSHEEPDMLNISYTLQPYPFGNSSDEKMQLLDGYLRLDNNLSQLFKAVDAGPGLDNTLFFIVGTPANTRSRREEEKWRLPSGEFSPKKAISLLNLYLINKFGNGDWVSGYHNGFFYLNPTAAANHKVEIADVRAEAAAFLRRMAGVAGAYSVDDILDNRTHDDFPLKGRNVHHATTGDIYVSVAPGWRVVDIDGNDNMLAQRLAPATAPGFILYPGLERQTISRPVDARSIAPTMATIMRIRPPTGANQPPVRLLRKK